MRILFFIESLQSGGKERRCVELVSYLKRTSPEYEMEIVLTEDEIHFDEIVKTGIRITILKRRYKYDPGLFSGFLKVCRRFNPDIIHSWGKMSAFYAIPAKIICKIPLVSNLIADTTASSSTFKTMLRRINIYFSDVILSNSDAGLRAYKIRTPKAKVIYNGVNLMRFSDSLKDNDAKNELRIRDMHVVIMVATFSHLKDHNLFLDVAVQISKQRSDVTFLAVGDGPTFKQIKERINNEAINNVILTGRRNDVERLISASDIGILCTFSEGISNSLIEYMALGKPVIVTDTTGGSPELVTEGVTGFCIDRNQSKMTGLLNYLLDNPELGYEMGRRGKERINTMFSITRMGKEYEELYENIAGFQKVLRSPVINKATGQQ